MLSFSGWYGHYTLKYIWIKNPLSVLIQHLTYIHMFILFKYFDSANNYVEQIYSVTSKWENISLAECENVDCTVACFETSKHLVCVYRLNSKIFSSSFNLRIFFPLVSQCQVMFMEEALHTSDGDKKEQAAWICQTRGVSNLPQEW